MYISGLNLYFTFDVDVNWFSFEFVICKFYDFQ